MFVPLHPSDGVEGDFSFGQAEQEQVVPVATHQSGFPEYSAQVSRLPLSLVQADDLQWSMPAVVHRTQYSCQIHT